MKAVFDTNVFLSSFLTEGVCAKLLLRARRKQFILITCPFILQEVQNILKRKFSATRGEIQSTMKLISEAAQTVIHPNVSVDGVCRDPDDDNILACVLEANADFLVTGDEDLLTLKKFHKASIISPRNFESLFKD